MEAFFYLALTSFIGSFFALCVFVGVAIFVDQYGKKKLTNMVMRIQADVVVKLQGLVEKIEDPEHRELAKQELTEAIASNNPAEIQGVTQKLIAYLKDQRAVKGETENAGTATS